VAYLGNFVVFKMKWTKPCLDTKHTVNGFCVGFTHQGAAAQVTFTFGGFLIQQVTFERFESLYFSATGYFEGLLGPGMRFHFWHDVVFLRSAKVNVFC